MNKKLLKIGSRDSKLAIMQTMLVIDKIKKYHPEYDIELITLKTTGDLILDKTLDKIGGKGLFVKELDLALLDGRIDLAVHSLKDLPMEVNENFPIVAFIERGDARDVLVAPKKQTQDLFSNIGSSSARRILQIKKLIPNCNTSFIRGNIVTRLEKLDNGDYSSLILASAGLKRANLENRITRYFSTDEILPPAGQGTLVVQGHSKFINIFKDTINDYNTQLVSIAERSFVKQLNGGCSSPISAYATISNNTLTLKGLYFDEDSKKSIILSKTGNKTLAKQIGISLADECKGVLKNESR